MESDGSEAWDRQAEELQHDASEYDMIDALIDEDYDETSYPDPYRTSSLPYPVLLADTSSSAPDGHRHHILEFALDPALSSTAVPGPTHSKQSRTEDLTSAISLDDAAFHNVQIIAQQFYDAAGPPQGPLADDDGLAEDDGFITAGQMATDLDSEYDEATGVEDLIEDDESRPIKSKRKGKKANDTQAKARKRGWRQFLKGTEFENLGKGERGPAPPRKKTGRPRSHIDPGRDFKEALAKASQAFIAEDLEAAADHARAAIEANPEVFAAHSLLSEILRKQDRVEDSIRVLTWGAHVSRSPTVWLNILERILELIEENPTEELLKEALDCAKQALKLKSALNRELEYLLRRHRYQLYKQLGDTTAARKACKAMVKQWPGDMFMCREYAELCAAWKDPQELASAKSFFEDAFAFKNGQAAFDEEGESWRHIIAYLEVVSMIDEPGKAITAGKRLARWALARQDEGFWDSWTQDDREFDIEDDRREEVPGFRAGAERHDRSKYGSGLPIEVRIKFGLLRIRLGPSNFTEASKHFSCLLAYEESIEYYYDLYLQAAESLYQAELLEDAARLYDVLRDVPDVISEETWTTMGTCYESLSQREDAKECFEEVLTFKSNNYGLAGARLAKFYEDDGDLEQARRLCNEVITLGRRDLLQDAQVRLIPADSLRNRQASRLLPGKSAGPYVAARKDRSASESASHDGSSNERPSAKARRRTRTSPKSKKSAKRGGKPSSRAAREPVVKRPKLRKRPVKKVNVALERRLRQSQDASSRINVSFSIVQLHWPALRQNEDQEAIELWVSAATNLLEEFVETKVFFPERDKNMHVKLSGSDEQTFVKIAPRSAPFDAPREFHGIAILEWHKLFSELALYFAKSAEQDRCYKIVNDVLLTANVFWQIPEIERTGFAVAICCALIFNDEQYVLELTRKLINNSDYRSGQAFQLFAAVSRFTCGSNWFNAGPSQKYMLRMVKMSDYLAMPDDMRKEYDFAMSKPSMHARLTKLGGQTQDVNAHAILTYGHMVAVANHSHSALPYYFRALAIKPDDICINLSIATMWVQNSLKRQTENRHFGITQGLAFLYRYFELRTASGLAIDLQEAHYNVARTWHYLGLTHLAIPSYEKVLKLGAQVQAEHHPESDGPEHDSGIEIEDYSREAAMALQNIYALDGNEEAAMAITEEWLVL